MLVSVTRNPVEVRIPHGAKEVAVVNLTTKEQRHYCDELSGAIVGPERLNIGRCETKQEFIEEFIQLQY